MPVLIRLLFLGIPVFLFFPVRPRLLFVRTRRLLFLWPVRLRLPFRIFIFSCALLRIRLLRPVLCALLLIRPLPETAPGEFLQRQARHTALRHRTAKCAISAQLLPVIHSFRLRLPDLLS